MRKSLLMVPGPTPCPDEVLRALATQMINHRGPEYMALQRELIGGLKEVEESGRRQSHSLYGRLAEPEAAPRRAGRPAAALEGQRRFLEGLKALHRAGALHEFEESKARYIGSHGDDPLLLVQGPPGTGKSYATGYAVFAPDHRGHGD